MSAYRGHDVRSGYGNHEANTLYNMARETDNVRAIREEAMSRARTLRDSIQSQSFEAESDGDDGATNGTARYPTRYTANRSRDLSQMNLNSRRPSQQGRGVSSGNSSSRLSVNTEEHHQPHLYRQANTDTDQESVTSEEYMDEAHLERLLVATQSGGQFGGGGDPQRYLWENGSKIARALRHYRDKCEELEMKLRDTMLLQVNVDNKNVLLRYEVDQLRENMEEEGDKLALYQRLYHEKKKEAAYQRMQLVEMQKSLGNMQQALIARDQLISQHGLTLVLVADSGKSANGKDNRHTASNGQSSMEDNVALLSQDLIHRIAAWPGDDFESRLKALLSSHANLNEKVGELSESLRELKEECENGNGPLMSSSMYRRGGTPSKQRLPPSSPSLGVSQRRGSINNFQQALQQQQVEEAMDTAKKDLEEWKVKYAQAQSSIMRLENEIKTTNEKVTRTEAQVKRHKNIAETCEKNVEELKTEKRKLQRDLRDSNKKVEELTAQVDTLQRRLNRAAGISRNDAS